LHIPFTPEKKYGGLEHLTGVYNVSIDGLKYSFSVDSNEITKVMEVLLPLWIIFSVLLVFVTAVTFTAIGGEDLGYVISEFNKEPLISALLGPAISPSGLSLETAPEKLYWLAGGNRAVYCCVCSHFTWLIK